MLKITQILTIASCCFTEDISTSQTLMDAWNQSDSFLSPKLFKFALMLPFSGDQQKAKLSLDEKFKHVTTEEDEVHPNDVIGQLYDAHVSHGGERKHAHVFSNFNDVMSTFSPLILEARKNVGKVAKFQNFYHGGKKLASGKAQNLSSCFSNLGAKDLIKLEKIADDESVKVQTPLFEQTFSKEDFEPVENFLTEVCSLIDYSKLHKHSFDRQMMAYHLGSFDNLKSDLKENLTPVLESALEYFRKNIEKTYLYYLILLSLKDPDLLSISKYI